MRLVCEFKVETGVERQTAERVVLSLHTIACTRCTRCNQLGCDVQRGDRMTRIIYGLCPVFMLGKGLLYFATLNHE
jgi:ABC-type microcin C transport system permease subunit YejE